MSPAKKKAGWKPRKPLFLEPNPTQREVWERYAHDIFEIPESEIVVVGTLALAKYYYDSGEIDAAFIFGGRGVSLVEYIREARKDFRIPIVFACTPGGDIDAKEIPHIESLGVQVLFTPLSIETLKHQFSAARYLLTIHKPRKKKK